MKRYIKYIISIFSLSCIASCSINDEIANPNDGGHMSLRLVSSTMTRAEGDNDNSRNEDKLVSADLYFYASDGQDSTKNAKWHTKINIEGEVNEKHEITNLTLPSNIMQSVFGNGDSGYLYVIANYPSTATALPTYTSGSTEIANSSIKELAMYEATAQWGPSNASDKTDDCVQDSFLMAGASAITKSASNVEGTIYLTRAAAKIELTITGFNGLPEGGVEDGEGNHWLPDFITHNTDGQEVISIGAFVKLQNAVANSYVGAPMAAESYEYDETTAAEGFYGYSTRADDGSYSQLIPFYSYSSDWSATGGANRASLLLVVPWKKVGTNEGQNCYYEIPIGARDNNLIERNKHYKIGVNVGTLGSFAPSTNVKITPAYITVVDWSTGQIDVNIAEAKYLVVDQTEIEIFNQNEYSIGYASSHPDKTTVKILSVTRDDMSSEVVGTTTFYSGDGVTSIDAGVWDDDEKYKLLKGFNVALQNNMIVFTHDLVNEDENSSVNADSYPTSGDFRNVDDYDFAPYYITLEVSMEVDDNTTFSEQITIIQYPQLYAKASQNSDYGNGGGYNDDHNLMVNAYYCKENTQEYEYKVNTNQQTFGTAPGLWTSGTGTNRNPNMYVVTATAFSSDSPYFIGDPRQLENDTDLINATWNHDNNRNTAQVSIWVNTVDINGKTRRLQYYYPTNQERVGNDANNPASYVTGYMVAPKFRVASSYSVTHNTNSKDLAEKRCASYQEDGYPAGRWRLPTYAEAAFMVKLSNEQKIPPLFNAGTNYWCAHGAFIPASDGTVTLNSTGSAQSVRCVYDEWYWGSGQIANKSTFTWGDKQR